MKKISYDGWLTSIEKQRAMKRRVNNGERIVDRGFRDLEVMEKSAYCEEFKDCCCCPLGMFGGFDEIRVCTQSLWTDSYFSRFVIEMRKRKIDYDRVYVSLTEMKNAIRKDCPDIDRAVKENVYWD